MASVRLLSFFFGGSIFFTIIAEVGLDILVELVQPKEENVFYSFCRTNLENIIFIQAADLLILRDANLIVLCQLFHSGYGFVIHEYDHFSPTNSLFFLVSKAL